MSVDPVVTRLANALVVPGACDDTVPDWLAAEAEAGLASVCWFGGAPPAGLKAQAPDLVVLADEEGGTVTRVERVNGSSWPGNAALGVVDDVALTRAAGAGIGALCRAAAVDVALAPVVDVNSAADNPVIGVRSFGAESALVARHGAAFVTGLQSAGIAACAKHFPGHGATHVDSHLDLPVVADDRETVLGRDVAPFAAAIEAGVRCILTAHVSIPAVDPAPATMSARWMSLLRRELGFEGVVISDALDMRAISGGVGRGAGAVAALRAGVDLLCVGNPGFPDVYDNLAVVGEVRGAIVAAVEGGQLTVGRLEEATGRLDALRSWLRQAAEGAAVTVDAGLAGEIARRAVVARGDVHLDRAPQVVVEQRTNVAAGRVVSHVAAAIVARMPEATTVVVESLGEAGDLDPDRPVAVVTDGLGDPTGLEGLRARRPDAVVVHTGSVGSAASLAGPAVVAPGNNPPLAAAVAELLFG